MVGSASHNGRSDMSRVHWLLGWPLQRPLASPEASWLFHSGSGGRFLQLPRADCAGEAALRPGNRV